MSARLHPFAAEARRAELLDAADALLVTRLCERAASAGHHAEGAGDALAAVLCALCRACADGSLCITEDEDGLGEFLRTLLSAGDFGADDAGALAGRFLAAANAGRYDAILGTPASPRPLIRAHGNLYFHRHWFAERTVAAELAARRGASAPADEDILGAILQDTLVANPLRAPDGDALELTARQRLALETALRERVFVLSGGPGTGKTTWTAAWLRAVLRLPGVAPARVRLCAPTGRAARRLEESLRERLAGTDASGPDEAAHAVGVTTLHALLGYRAFEGRFARGPGDPLDADWVLLDEASMADVFLLAALVRALRPGTRLVLAGDPDQLPAVGAGAVLADLLPESPDAPGPVPAVTLDTGHRARGAVIPLAAAVRAGDAEAVLETLGAPCAAGRLFASGRSVARAEPDPGADAGLPALMEAHAGVAFGAPDDGTPGYAALLDRFRRMPRDEEPGVLALLWSRVARARVLAPLRRGPVSAERANRLLRGRLEPAWRLPGDARGTGFHGAPILVTRNDDRTGLSNGDVGIWLEAGDGTAVFFPRPDRPDGWLRIPAALLPPHELGFASTVHKSQGSEYDAVLLLLPEPGNRLLARETLYTAITRARASVFIFGAEDALRQATTRTLRRHGGLKAAFANTVA